MHRFAAILILCLLPLTVGAGDLFATPAGTGTLEFKEKLSVSGGCGSLKGVAFMSFEAFGDSTWEATTPAGTFSGRMFPADTKGRRWQLQFEGGSLDGYLDYIESEASDLCETPVSISGFGFDKFELKLDKNLTKLKFKLKSSGTGSTAFGTGRGKHALSGKGIFIQSM